MRGRKLTKDLSVHEKQIVAAKYAYVAGLIDSGKYIKTSEAPGAGLIQFLRGPLPEYPPPHHKGAALWMPSEPGSRHWPGCGCP